MTHLQSIGINVRDLAQATRFYEAALGCVRDGEIELVDLPSFGRLRIKRQKLRLGQQSLELTQCDPQGESIPADSISSDLWFQHIAIVVTDMRAAYARLQGLDFTPITRDGPQLLPPEAGSVWAFKFRDLDGHPLELLQFQPGSGPAHLQAMRTADLSVGYDHSAISVANVERSIAFYQQRLGLRCLARQINRGVAQERLDDALDVSVEVVALQVSDIATPHVELLGYRTPQPRGPFPIQVNDIAATRMIFAAEQNASTILERDPDGHLIVMPHGAATASSAARSKE